MTPGITRQGDVLVGWFRTVSSAKASGKIKVNPTYKLKPKKVKPATGETKTLKLKPKKAKAKKIAGALKRGEKAKARLSVKLTGLAGNREAERFTVRLKR